MLYKIFMKFVKILRKVPPVNSEVLVDLKNIESPVQFNSSNCKRYGMNLNESFDFGNLEIN